MLKSQSGQVSHHQTITIFGLVRRYKFLPSSLTHIPSAEGVEGGSGKCLQEMMFLEVEISAVFVSNRPVSQPFI